MLTPVAWGFSLFRSFLQKLWSPRGRPEFLGLRSRALVEFEISRVTRSFGASHRIQIIRLY